jgi:Alcohol dehydrogenase transcription factor Myb/SANT-like
MSSFSNEINLDTTEQIDGNHFLIQEVKQYPSLYNCDSRDKEKKNKLWIQISAKCGISGKSTVHFMKLRL